MSLQAVALSVLAFLAGVSLAVQAPINAMTSSRLGHPLGAATLSFAVGTICLVAITLLTARSQIDWSKLVGMSPLLWLGGVLGVAYITIAILLTPVIGVGALLALVIAGQITASLLLDHYGLLGLVGHEITMGRVAGALLVIVGAVMVRFL
jgi:transporter family-2 protein